MLILRLPHTMEQNTVQRLLIQVNIKIAVFSCNTMQTCLDLEEDNHPESVLRKS